MAEYKYTPLLFRRVWFVFYSIFIIISIIGLVNLKSDNKNYLEDNFNHDLDIDIINQDSCSSAIFGCSCTYTNYKIINIETGETWNEIMYNTSYNNDDQTDCNNRYINELSQFVDDDHPIHNLMYMMNHLIIIITIIIIFITSFRII